MNHSVILPSQSNRWQSEQPGLFSYKEKTEFITTQQLYDAVFENAFHPMYIGNGRDKVIRFNEKFLKLFQLTKEDIRNVRALDLFDREDEAFIEFIEERKEKGIAKAELSCIKKSGEKFPCRISSVFYESDSG
ncbi:MAG TPA: PAS domain-containing protein, partial [Hanamia sp.]|nr:PAS domain-containing protein [Hanamia sp.]